VMIIQMMGGGVRENWYFYSILNRALSTTFYCTF
ncbi:MAG: hypothetical protein ACI8RD_001257, partial [Bacillariaceae sp.]|jgi:hypothetical protein